MTNAALPVRQVSQSPLKLATHTRLRGEFPKACGTRSRIYASGRARHRQDVRRPFQPLLVSVRSEQSFDAGMMDTVLNLGLNDER